MDVKQCVVGEITVRNFRRGRSVELDLGHLWIAEVHFTTPSGSEVNDRRIGWVVYGEGRWKASGSSIDADGSFWDEVRTMAAEGLNELYPNGLPEETPTDSPATEA